MVMRLFGSKKEEKKEAPPEPKLDMNNKEQIREVEKDFKRKLQKEIREIDRAILSKKNLKQFQLALMRQSVL